MRQFQIHINEQLKFKYSNDEIKRFGLLILERLTGFTQAQILTRRDFVLSQEQRRVGEEWINRLFKNEPIQYVLGEADFYGMTFTVTPAVLIPRPETEELLQWILDDIQQYGNPPSNGIIDIGSGSGCIAIALKKNLDNIPIVAMDISDEALSIARNNAARNKVDVSFIHDDILNPKIEHNLWDIIVSNPPYIPFSEKQKMDRYVVDSEPEIALFVPDHDPLLFYRKIAEYAINHLTINGAVYVETHRDYAGQCAGVFDQFGFHRVEIRKDISGNERMVKACDLYSN